MGHFAYVLLPPTPLVYAGRCVVRVQRHAESPGMCSPHQARTKGSSVLGHTAMETEVPRIKHEQALSAKG